MTAYDDWLTWTPEDQEDEDAAEEHRKEARAQAAIDRMEDERDGWQE